MIKAICLDNRDNVITAIADIKAGANVLFYKNNNEVYLTVKEDVPLGFKVALTDMSEKAPVIKYGEIIGEAIESISEGTIVHTHNLQSIRGRNKDVLEGASEN